jgi:TonB family protein
LRPIVLLPVSAVAGLTPDQLEAVLAHELAHIRRHDYLVNLLQMAAETLLFYHPAVWWISSRIRQERELCCDDLAVRTCGGAIPYARALTALEKMRAARPALALGSTDGPLFFRIRRLVMGGSEYGPSKLSGMVALTLGLVSLALTVNWARAQQLVVPARGFAVELRDNSGVTVDTAGSMVLHRPELEYPEELRAKGVQGTVSVEAILDNTGEVIDARVLSGPNELRKAALASVLHWHFAPGSGNTKIVQIGFQPPAAPSVEPGSNVALFISGANSKEFHMSTRPKVQVANLNEEAQRLEQLKSELVEAQAKLASEAQQQLASEEAHRVDTLKSEFAETQAKLELARKQFADENAREYHEKRLRVEVASEVKHEEAPRLDMPRRLAAIQIAGLSEEARKDLLSRLPFREGDTLSQESAEAAAKIVKDFDQHLELSTARFDDDVILRIHRAGMEPRIFRVQFASPSKQ